MSPDERLRELLSRARLVLKVRALLLGLEASCALALLLLLASSALGLLGVRGAAWTLAPALCALLGLIGWGVLLAARRMGPVYLAWEMERGFPAFDSFLITAAESLDRRPYPEEARLLLSRLQEKLTAVSPWRLPRGRPEVMARVALVASLALSATVLSIWGGGAFESAGRFLWGSPAPRLRVAAVHPGDATIREGGELEVAALVWGGPEQVRLKLGEEELPMAPRGGVWRASVSPAAGGNYAVEARRGKSVAFSPQFSVSVLPLLEAALAFRVRPPLYTRLKESVVRGPDIRVPKGSELDAVLTGAEEARFAFDGKPRRMKRAPDNSLRVRLRTVESGPYELEYSRGKLMGTVVVVEDSAPELSVGAKGFEGERLALRVRASDDYGLGECTVHVSARGLSKEYGVGVPEAALEYSKKVFLPESFTSSLPDGTEVVYWAEVRDLSPEKHVVRTPPRRWALQRPESRSPLFGSRRKKRKLRERPRGGVPPAGGSPPPPPQESAPRGLQTLEEEAPSPPAPAERGAGKASDYASEQTSPEAPKEKPGGRSSPRDAGPKSAGKQARPSPGSRAAGPGGKGSSGAGGGGGPGGGTGGTGGSKHVQRPRDGGPKTGRETGPAPEGREAVDRKLVESVVPGADEIARALALAARNEHVGGGRGKRAKAEGEDASALPQAKRLKGKLGFSEGRAGTMAAADYDELYREIAREYFRRLGSPER